MNRIALSMLLVTALAACGSDAESREALEAQETTRAVPSQPAATAPAASPIPAVLRAIPAGSVLTFEVREDVSTSSHVPGDGFSLVLVDAVTGPAGARLSGGTPAEGVVTDVHKSTGPDDDSLLGVRIVTVEAGGAQKAIQGQVQSAQVESSTQDSGARTAATIAIGTAAGAVIGQIVGGNTRSTVTGAAAGTVVGVVVALTTRGGEAKLPQGSRITVRLDEDLVY